MELDPAEKPGFTRRLVKRTSSMLDGASERTANWLNRWFPHPSTEEGDAYTAKMEKVYSQGCDPVTGAPNLDSEPMQGRGPQRRLPAVVGPDGHGAQPAPGPPLPTCRRDRTRVVRAFITPLRLNPAATAVARPLSFTSGPATSHALPAARRTPVAYQPAFAAARHEQGRQRTMGAPVTGSSSMPTAGPKNRDEKSLALVAHVAGAAGDDAPDRRSR